MERKEDDFLRSFRFVDAFLRVAFWLCAAVCFVTASVLFCATAYCAIGSFFVTTQTTDGPSLLGIAITAGFSGLIYYWLGTRAARCSAFFRPIATETVSDGNR